MERLETPAPPPPARPATQDWLDDLAAEGLLSGPQWSAASELLRGSAPWRLAADRLLAIAGTCLVLAGIVFFFAYNWRVMPPFAKFAVIELALVLAVLTAARRGLDDLIGRLATLVASVLVGVFLAVFGQVYQTGADAWQLFATWGALITPWAALVRFAPLWALWLGVVDLAICLFISEAHVGLSESSAAIAVAAVHALALLARERAAAADPEVARESWLRQAILGVLLGALLLPTFATLGGERVVRSVDLLGFAAWLAASAGAWRYYSAWRPDLFSLCLVALSACVGFLYGVGATILPRSDLGMFFVFALVVVATFSAAVFAVRTVMTKMLEKGGTVE